MDSLTVMMKGQTASIDLYGPIGAMPGGVMADDFVGALSEAKSFGVDNLHVNLNSPGGDYAEGIAMYHRLMQAGESMKVTTTVEGKAYSATSLLMLAGHERQMLHGTRAMVHEGSMMSGGNAAELEKKVAILRDINDEAAAIYADRTNWSLSEAKEKMAAETWLNADDAYKAGFTTVAPTGEVVSRAALHVPESMFALYKHPPQEVTREHVEAVGATAELRQKADEMRARMRGDAETAQAREDYRRLQQQLTR